ncbi:unnamed protein product [Amoebophrya sp. A25]|nr:unnamed protein product [Amoebophrya sp. A25]|eukprot:GSA25T00014898001.1
MALQGDNNEDAPAQVAGSPLARKSLRQGGIGLKCENLCVNVAVVPTTSATTTKAKLAEPTPPATKPLLKNVSVEIAAGDFIAVMGASGAGKTTFLNTLMGRPGAGATWTGDLIFDGNVNMGKSSSLAERDKLRQRMGYVTQDDVILYRLTPREQIQFRLELVRARQRATLLAPSSGTSASPPQAEAQTSSTSGTSTNKATTILDEPLDTQVDRMLAQLGLRGAADTIVGEPGTEHTGISGGERKRTNVALSLCGDPDFLLLDEPTSGLDSRKARNLVQDLKDLTLPQKDGPSGMTIVSTIHQPSEETFELFKKVLLFHAGEVAFFGSIDELRALLKEIGCPVPPGTNLAEHIMDVLEDLSEKVELMKRRYNSMPSSITSAEDKNEGLKQIKIVEDAGSASSTAAKANAQLCGSYSQVFSILLRRNARCMRREPWMTKIRLAQSLIVGGFVGALFFQIERNLVGVRNRAAIGFLLCLTQLLFASFGMVNVFLGERPVFLRESLDRLYTPWQYYIAKILLDIPLQTFYACLTGTVAYFLVGLNVDQPHNYFYAMLIMSLMANCGGAIGFLVAAKTGDISKTLAILPGTVLPQVLLSGFMIDVGSMYPPFSWLSFIMFFRFAWQGMTFNEFDCKTAPPECSSSDPTNGWIVQGRSGTAGAKSCDDSPCPFCCDPRELIGEMGLCPVTTCEAALQNLGMTGGDVWPRSKDTDDIGESTFYSVLMLLGLASLFRVVAGVVLNNAYRQIERSSSGK